MHRVLALLLMMPTVALGAESGPQILQKVDHVLNAFKDGTFVSTLEVKQPDGSSRKYGFTTYQKSPDKRLVRFTSPGDVKGMGVLIENAETMYVFLPGFQRVRRMGTHIKNQTFMGSDFSFEDMSQVSFSPTYDAKIASQDAKTWTLELTAKKGKDPEFPRIKMVVDKTMAVPLRMDYYDAGGKLLKTQLRDGYTKDSPEHYQPGTVTVIDHRRNDHKSEIVFSSSKIDTGLSDDLFTQRSLIRGN